MDGLLLGLLTSHALFVLSGVSYSIYWVLQETAPGATAVALFFVSILSGFAAAIATFSCVLAALPLADDRRPRLWQIVLANAALLVGAALLTTRVVVRPLTSELPFVFIWSTAEFCAIRVAIARGWLPGRRAGLATALVSAGLAVGVICYVAYFSFDATARFRCGLVPYGAIAIAMAAVGALLWRGRVSPARLE
jgi:hypothetical protein